MANTIEQALIKAISNDLYEDDVVMEKVKELAGAVISAAARVRADGPRDEAAFADAMMCEVHNTILAGVSTAVKLVVLNWEDPHLTREEGSIDMREVGTTNPTQQ